MTTFNVIKNVNKSFSIVISGFVENVPPAGSIYSFANIADTITMAVSTPTTTTNPTAAFSLSSPDIAISTPTSITTGPSNLSLNTSAASCTIVQGRTNSFGTENNTGIWIGTETTGGIVTGRYKAWIPFTVAIPQGSIINSAIITLVAYATSSNDCGLKIACDNRGNSITPTNYDELNIITLTANSTVDSACFTMGSNYILYL